VSIPVNLALSGWHTDGVTGFMRQRGPSWQLIVHAGRDPVTGKKRYVSRSVKGSKREAERALAAFVTEVGHGVPADTVTTVGELLDAWLAQARGDFSPSTVRETQGIIERNLRPGLGHVRLDRLRVPEIDAYYRRLLDGSANQGRPLAASTIRRLHGILRRALGQAVRWGWIAHNYAADATPPRVHAPEVRPPTPTEVGRLFRIASEKDPALATFVILAAATGARRSELVALRWSDIDIDRARITIRHGIVLGPDGLVEKDTKTHAVRNVSVDPTSLAALVAYQARLDRLASAFGTTRTPGSFVFSVEPDGTCPARPDSMSRSFRLLCVKAGVTGVRLHDLRHYVATQLLAGGVDVRTVAGRLGHRNPSTTLNVYSHFLPEADPEAAALLGRLFDINSGPASDSDPGRDRGTALPTMAGHGDGPPA